MTHQQHAATAPRPWDAADIKQPHWGHVFAAFVEGAREARANPEATEYVFGRAADAHTKRVLEEIDPVSEAALRTGSWVAEQPAADLSAELNSAPGAVLDLPSGAAPLGTYRNVDDGATFAWGRCDDGYFLFDQFGWATWPTQEGFSRALLRAAAPQAQAHEASAAPATSTQVQALHRARRALHAIGKTYDDSELRTRALEADEEIDRLLAAAPPATAAPATETQGA